MKGNNEENSLKSKFSRRKFFKTMGTTAAGLLAAPYLKSANVFAYGYKENLSYLAKVAITKADNYERTFIKNKVQYLFEKIDGINDIVKSGNKVAMKINLTGGSSSVPYNMWTHPEVVRAVGELVLDCGVSPQNLYIVESLWSSSSYNDTGFSEVQKSLGANLVDLNNPAPYESFIEKEVGSGSFNFSSFTMNQILSDADVYISIPKMKQHYQAGFTGSLKNQVGTVPKDLYTIPTNQVNRAALHNRTGGPSNSHLPRSVCDLNRARPVNLAVIDGIMNARGGEGTWNSTFKICEDHVLLAGKDAVATDSVAAFFMGLNPEAEKLPLPNPDNGECDNHLYLLNQFGMGTNKMSEIEVVGDGKDLITDVRQDYKVSLPTNIKLLQNYPNPFNPSTIIRFYVPAKEFITLKIYNVNGQEVETLLNGDVPSGEHELHWNAGSLASGVYIYQLRADKYVDSKKMIYLK